MASYAHRPALAFECGAIDERVPPDGARRFVTALADVYGDAAASRLQDTLHPDVGHETVPAMMENCLDWLRRHAQAAVGFVDLGSDAAVQSRQGAGSLVRTA